MDLVTKRSAPRKIAPIIPFLAAPTGFRFDPLLWILLGLALVEALFMMSSAFSAPLDRDEGAFATIGAAILSGKLPYRDFIDHKSPGIYYLAAAILAAFSKAPPWEQANALRSLALIVDCVTATLTFQLGKKLYGNRIGVAAGILTLLLLIVFDGGKFFTEVFSLPFMVGALIASLSRNRRGAIASGLLLAAASMFKQTAILELAALFAINPFRWSIIIASSAPWIPLAAAFMVGGALAPFTHWVIAANASYPREPASEYRRDLLLASPIIVLSAFLMCTAAFSQRLSAAFDARLLALVLWIILGSTPFMTHAYVHYWLQVVPPLAIVTSLAVDKLMLSKSYRLRLTALTGLASLLFFTSTPLTSANVHIDLNKQLADAASINTLSKPTTRLLVAPAEPEYYFLTGASPRVDYLYVLDINRAAVGKRFLSALRNGSFDVVAWYGNCQIPENLEACRLLSSPMYRRERTDIRTQLQLFRNAAATKP